jgi:hypothetical protein
MRLFYFRPIGSGNAYGPIEARDERDARKKAHQTFPRVRIEVWETTREAMQQIQDNYKRNYHPMYACE